MKKERMMKGIISLLIMNELKQGPLHGYAIEKRINDKTGFHLPPGMIYVMLKSLEKKGCVRGQEKKGDSGRIVKIYHITERGIDFLTSHREQLLKMKEIIDDILKGMEGIK